MASADRPDALTRTNWRRIPEVGTVLGIKFVIALATLFGRRVATAFLWILALYYALVSARARHASKSYLARAGEPPTFGAVLRHLHMFARVSLDRLFFLRGRLADFQLETHGEEHLFALREKGTGALLLGSHLGSFEVMRAASRDRKLHLSVVVDSRSAERLGRIVRELAADTNVSIIAVDPDGIGTALKVREAIQRGEVVGILADRIAVDDTRNVTVDFLGAPAPLPVGPYVVAHALRCPVYQVFGLFTAPDRYDLYCEPFAERVVLERGAREASLVGYAQRYADRLEHYVRLAPYNWFNLYDFWALPLAAERGRQRERAGEGED